MGARDSLKRTHMTRLTSSTDYTRKVQEEMSSKHNWKSSEEWLRPSPALSNLSSTSHLLVKHSHARTLSHPRRRRTATCDYMKHLRKPATSSRRRNLIRMKATLVSSTSHLRDSSQRRLRSSTKLMHARRHPNARRDYTISGLRGTRKWQMPSASRRVS